MCQGNFGTTSWVCFGCLFTGVSGVFSVEVARVRFQGLGKPRHTALRPIRAHQFLPPAAALLFLPLKVSFPGGLGLPMKVIVVHVLKHPFKTAKVNGVPRFLIISREFPLGGLGQRVCKDHGVNLKELRSGSRRHAVVGARQELSRLGIMEHGYSGAEIARYLGVTTSCITRPLSSTAKNVS